MFGNLKKRAENMSRVRFVNHLKEIQEREEKSKRARRLTNQVRYRLIKEPLGIFFKRCPECLARVKKWSYTTDYDYGHTFVLFECHCGYEYGYVSPDVYIELSSEEARSCLQRKLK